MKSYQLISLVFWSLVATGPAAETGGAAAVVEPTGPVESAMLALDFDAENALPGLSAKAEETGGGRHVTAVADWARVGSTGELPGQSAGTGALRLRVNSGPGVQSWSGRLDTGLLPVKSSEGNLELLTLAFDLQSSAARPVMVRMESWDASRQRTGGLEGRVLPAAPGFLHRHTLDGGQMTAWGEGKFQPLDPFVSVSFWVESAQGWSSAAGHSLVVDNLSWTAPAFYVSPDGKDTKERGRRADQPLLTVQQALDRAKAGDVIMVMEGVYERKYTVAHFRTSGRPAAWIVLRNYPGQKPVLRSTGWDCIKIGQGSRDTPSTEPATAFVEMRGLTVRGYSTEVKEKYADKIGKSAPETNGNGISIDGRFTANKPHHIRIAGCTVFECAGGGISAIHTDRISVESNHTHNNCHWMIYAGSGISVYQPFNFDVRPGESRILVRNNRTHDNFCTQPWEATGKVSDGNGLIVDDTRNTQNQSPNGNYHGRILVQNNISYRNGGSGMHAFSSDHVDFIHNTAVGNNSVMDYSQIGITQCTDCRVLNNVMSAPADKPVNRVNGKFSEILTSHNLFHGGNGSVVPGVLAVEADPLFVNAEAGDFRLKAGSPAIGQGGAWEILPSDYQDGTLRPVGQAPTPGALPVVP